MNPSSSPELKKQENVVVVYDEKCGTIRHIHQVYICGEGSDDRSQADVEKTALEIAEQFGHKTQGLKTMTVRSAEVRDEANYKVDLSSLKIVVDPRKE